MTVDPEYELGDTRLPGVFWDYVLPNRVTGCWQWIGPRDDHGYSLCSHSAGDRKAYRVIYKAMVGPIPARWHIDHLCRVPWCVNPAHLEAVPHRVNILRGIGPTAINASKTHCPSGHPYEGQNVGYRKDGGRRCQTCNNEHQKAWRARRASSAEQAG